jgi:hypothetical protein
MRTEFLTTPLWGVGSTPPYGHDGRSINLMEVILRHGGEAQAARDTFARLPSGQQARIIAFLNSLSSFSTGGYCFHTRSRESKRRQLPAVRSREHSFAGIVQ